MSEIELVALIGGQSGNFFFLKSSIDLLNPCSNYSIDSVKREWSMAVMTSLEARNTETRNVQTGDDKKYVPFEQAKKTSDRLIEQNKELLDLLHDS